MSSWCLASLLPPVLRLPSVILMAGAVMAVAGCMPGSTVQRSDIARLDSEYARAETALIHQDSAPTLIVAAQLAQMRWSLSTGASQSKHDPEPKEWSLAQHASSLAPRNPAIAWVRVALCVLISGCDVVAAAAQFRSIDPDNAAGWLPALAAAAKRSPTAVDAVLASMSRSTKFSLYFNRRVVETANAFQRAGATPGYGQAAGALARLSAASALAAALPVPGITALAKACDAQVQIDRDKVCDAISATMAHGDELLLQMLAADIEIRRREPGDPMRIAAEAARRTLAWQMHLLSSVESPLFDGNQRATERLRLMARLPTEVDVMRTLLQRQHQPLEPPAGWQLDQ